MQPKANALEPDAHPAEIEEELAECGGKGIRYNTPPRLRQDW
jgi:hypothetical protein